MKKKADMKKLALMGMAAGMLLSNDKAEANFGNNDNNNFNNPSYLAAKCGSKCGGAVASSCGAHSCNAVADRGQSTSYYYQSCSGQSRYNSCNATYPQGYNSHSCGGSSQPNYNSHSCGGSSQPNYGSHSCGGSSAQGYYDPSQWAANQGQQNSSQTKGQNSSQQQGGKYAGNNQGQQQQQQQQQGKGQQPSNQGGKYQAAGCGAHGCNAGTSAGPNNNGRFQASNGCGGSNRPSSNNTSGSGYYNPNQVAEAEVKAAPAKLNEGDFLSKLNAQGKSTYNSLTPEGKKLALQLANAECKGKNDCKGLNSCKSDKNECAGKGGCKGQSTCSFKDKNLAVKVAAAKMAEKRNGLQNKK